MTEADTRINRIELIVAAVLQIAIAAVGFGAAIQGYWLLAFSGFVVLLLTFTPAMIERQLHVTLPVEFTLLTCIFLFASFVLGEVRDFYERFWWWDLALHGVSALLLGFIGFLAVYVFHMTRRIEIKPFYIAVFTFCFAVTIGALWEILEFFADWYLGTNMQKSGIVDTMSDQIIDALGAFVAATMGFFYVRNGDSHFVRRLLSNYADRKDIPE